MIAVYIFIIVTCSITCPVIYRKPLSDPALWCARAGRSRDSDRGTCLKHAARRQEENKEREKKKEKKKESRNKRVEGRIAAEKGGVRG